MKFVAALILIIFPTLAISSPAEEPPDNRIPILETAQEIFGARANFAANRLDSFFATERADDEFGRTRIRIRSQFNMAERAVSDLNNQYRINLKLPHLEQKFRFDYYQDKNKEKEKREKKSSSPVISDIEERERLKKNRLFEGWIFNSDIGVSAAIPPRLVTRARVRKNFTTGIFINRFSEQLTYITDENGLIEETTLESDYSFSTDVLFRFLNYKRWQIQNEFFNTNHGPSLLHRLTENDAFNYSLTMQSEVTDNVWFVNNYRLAVNYRRNLYRQWVYLDLVPGIDFPKNWSFRRTPFLFLQLELLFGGS